MAYPKNSSAILPATQALFDKTKATLEESMLRMGKYGGGGTMLICLRENGDGKVTPFFLSSAGDMTSAADTKFQAHHDQNFRSYGVITVRAAIRYSVINEQVICELPTLNFGNGPLTLDSKAPLFVFK